MSKSPASSPPGEPLSRSATPTRDNSGSEFLKSNTGDLNGGHGLGSLPSVDRAVAAARTEPGVDIHGSEKENEQPVTSSTAEKRPRCTSKSDSSSEDDPTSGYSGGKPRRPKRRRLQGPAQEMMEMIQRSHEEERRMREADQRRRDEHDTRVLAFLEESRRSQVDFQNRLLDTIASLKD